MSIHVYGQPFHHADVFIVGTPDDLKELVRVINIALSEGASSMDTFTDDGEGYYINAVCTSDEVMVKVRLPYYDDMAIDSRPNVIDPWQVPLFNSASTNENA